MNPLRKDSVDNKTASQLRQAFDHSFALPPSVASAQGEEPQKH